MSGGQVLTALKLYSLYPYAVSLLLLVGIYMICTIQHTTPRRPSGELFFPSSPGDAPSWSKGW
jgi:hypothetical protein